MSSRLRITSIALLVASAVGCTPNAAPENSMKRSKVEYDLLKQIHDAEDSTTRATLITKLEATSVDRVPFYDRWIRLHKPWALECWTDDGYDSSLSDLHPDIQLLPSMCYGKFDIYNGGLHQLFVNGTGVMAPEMQQWCERAGLQATADVLGEAIAVFGSEFPRSQSVRQTYLMEYSKRAQASDAPESWNPFSEMDNRFYSSCDGFDTAADKWLREVCGITSLHTPPGGITKP